MASTSFVAILHFAGFPQFIHAIARDRIAARPTLDCTTPGGDVGACHEA
jgi:hypothetical protein